MVGGGVDLGPGEIEGTRGQYVLAHNGWVMNADPMVNFAAEGSQVRCVGSMSDNTFINLLISVNIFSW